MAEALASKTPVKPSIPSSEKSTTPETQVPSTRRSSVSQNENEGSQNQPLVLAPRSSGRSRRRSSVMSSISSLSRCRRMSAAQLDSDDPPRLEDDLTEEEKARYKSYKAQFRRASRRLSFVEFIGRIVVEPRLPGFVQVFKKIRPLVLNLTTLPKIRAFRAFKFLSRLQKVCGVPYLPDLEKGRQLSPKADACLIKRMNRYCQYAIGVYDTDLLEKNGFDIDKGAPPTHLIIKKLHATLIAKRDYIMPTKPAWFLFSESSHKELVLVIQGSSSANDWLTNLLCVPSQTGAHEGMYTACCNIDEEIREAIVSFMVRKPKYTLVLCGHSLGGGVAALLLIRWHHEGTALSPHITSRMSAWAFGTPCYASRNVGLPFENKIFSVSFGRDIVGRLSYGSVRDVLLTLHGLTHTMSRVGKREIVKRLENEACTIGVNATSNPACLEHLSNIKAHAVSESTKDLEDDISDDGSASDMDVDLLDDEPSLSDSENTQAPPVFATYEAPLRTLERAEDMAFDAAKVKVKLPLPFKALNKIIKKRAKDIDRRSRALKELQGLPTSGFSRLADCCSCGGYSPVAPKGDPLRIAEDELLLKTLLAVQSAAISPEEQMMTPAGTFLLILPRIDFLEQSLPLPKLPFNKGDCVIFNFPRSAMMTIIREPVWSLRAITDHSGSNYAQCCTPELLKKTYIAPLYVDEQLEDTK
eukprot:Protomagalhaensia_sp_Gyna_25__4655@NODE_436_length_3443_cov_60_627791_g337_i0_p1_GENE_NODE_436_length_3443_cov_60_627791_g337_i0NODE_436_length_3443_cov_60_627791_g337_i0_p1_ORF_typecomplete_len697_score111_77Lipase_3/PF01764_25/1e22DUF2974/PF11187_8/9_1e03DUF2974/PF11187_8/7_5e05Hydrolase_4/PF12146_8/0_0026DUF676/PF05057_14/0_011DUF818/PF05677_12/0_018Abhydrolase_3/PF07859_13/0_038Abhydrolase_6/PF12697_7/0_12Chlorophyllase/PF07224_11/0_18DUF2048/PF09752_9/0_28PGAP1/PF07819_13/0_28_NODE_436_leng